jgi:hypothetical protein
LSIKYCFKTGFVSGFCLCAYKQLLSQLGSASLKHGSAVAASINKISEALQMFCNNIDRNVGVLQRGLDYSIVSENKERKSETQKVS